MKVFILFSILVFIYAIEERFEDFAELEDTNLGKTFFDTIEIAIKSHESIQNVFDILHEQDKNLVNDELSLEDKHQNFQKKCKKDLSDFDKILAVIQKNLLDLQQSQDANQPAKDAKFQLLQVKQQELNKVQAQINSMTDKRTKQNQKFQARLGEYQTSINLLQTVRRVFEAGLEYINSIHGSSLVEMGLKTSQKDEILDVISDAIEQGESMKQIKGMPKFFKMLNQVGSNLGYVGRHQETVEKIIQMCTVLENHLGNERMLMRNVDQMRDDMFKKSVQGLNDVKQELNANINTLKVDLNQLDQILKNIANEKHEEDEKQRQKGLQQEDRKRECDEEDFTYNQGLSQSETEKRTIDKIIGVSYNNQADLKAYIAIRNKRK